MTWFLPPPALCWVLRHREESTKAFLTTPRTIERTSTGARQATTALRPHANASSRLAASSIQKPPTCSLVSRYGPSVITTLPSCFKRNDFALLAPERPKATILPPAASNSSLRDRKSVV